MLRWHLSSVWDANGQTHWRSPTKSPSYAGDERGKPTIQLSNCFLLRFFSMITSHTLLSQTTQSSYSVGVYLNSRSNSDEPPEQLPNLFYLV